MPGIKLNKKAPADAGAFLFIMGSRMKTGLVNGAMLMSIWKRKPAKSFMDHPITALEVDR
jgi:hypothetical protein